MTTVADLLERVKRLNIEDESRNSIIDTEPFIIVKQKDQLLKGERPDGRKIGKYRSNKYARIKFEMNPLAGLGNVDLKLTGAFQGAIKVDVRTQTYDINSPDPKTGPLTKKYGDPFGLNEKSQTDYVTENLEPVFLARVRKVLEL